MCEQIKNKQNNCATRKCPRAQYIEALLNNRDTIQVGCSKNPRSTNDADSLGTTFRIISWIFSMLIIGIYFISCFWLTIAKYVIKFWVALLQAERSIKLSFMLFFVLLVGSLVVRGVCGRRVLRANLEARCIHTKRAEVCHNYETISGKKLDNLPMSVNNDKVSDKSKIIENKGLKSKDTKHIEHVQKKSVNIVEAIKLPIKPSAKKDNKNDSIIKKVAKVISLPKIHNPLNKSKQKNPEKPKKKNPVKPKQHNPAEPKQHNPVKPKQNNLVKHEHNNPVKPKENQPIKPKLNNPIKPKLNNPVKSKLNYPTPKINLPQLSFPSFLNPTKSPPKITKKEPEPKPPQNEIKKISDGKGNTITVIYPRKNNGGWRNFFKLNKTPDQKTNAKYDISNIDMKTLHELLKDPQSLVVFIVYNSNFLSDLMNINLLPTLVRRASGLTIG